MNWLNPSITSALGRALLHFIWEAALIAALLSVMGPSSNPRKATKLSCWMPSPDTPIPPTRMFPR